MKKYIKKLFINPLFYIAIPLILIIGEINSKNKFIKNNLLAIITLTLTFSTILISIFSAIYTKNADVKIQYKKAVQNREITLHTEEKWRFTLLLFEQNIQYNYQELFVLASYINPYGNKVLDKLVNSVIISILKKENLNNLKRNLIDILKNPKSIKINDDVVIYHNSIFEFTDDIC